MKIVVLMGSPNKKGLMSILMDNFKRGAEESGHEVNVIDVCRADVNPCIGCVKCGYEGPCVAGRHLKSALLTVAWNAEDWAFEALTAHYKTLVRYINFEDKGMVLGYGCGAPSMTTRSRYPQEAYQLGKSLSIFE